MSNDKKDLPGQTHTDEFQRALSNFQSSFSRQAAELRVPSPVIDFPTEMNPLYAETFFDRLVRRIAEFEDILPDDKDIGAEIAGYGAAKRYYILDVGYHNPNLLWIRGTAEDEEDVELVQNFTQFNCIHVPMRQRESSPFRIAARLLELIGRDDEE